MGALLSTAINGVAAAAMGDGKPSPGAELPKYSPKAAPAPVASTPEAIAEAAGAALAASKGRSRPPRSATKPRPSTQVTAVKKSPIQKSPRGVKLVAASKAPRVTKQTPRKTAGGKAPVKSPAPVKVAAVDLAIVGTAAAISAPARAAAAAAPKTPKPAAPKTPRAKPAAAAAAAPKAPPQSAAKKMASARKASKPAPRMLPAQKVGTKRVAKSKASRAPAGAKRAARNKK